MTTLVSAVRALLDLVRRVTAAVGVAVDALDVAGFDRLAGFLRVLLLVGTAATLLLALLAAAFGRLTLLALWAFALTTLRLALALAAIGLAVFSTLQAQDEISYKIKIHNGDRSWPTLPFNI